MITEIVLKETNSLEFFNNDKKVVLSYPWRINYEVYGAPYKCTGKTEWSIKLGSKELCFKGWSCHLDQDEARELWDELIEAGWTYMQTLEGKTFVFTGFRDIDAEHEIINLNGRFSDRVTKRTTHLVMKRLDSRTAKAMKAKRYGAEIWSRDELENYLEKIGEQ